MKSTFVSVRSPKKDSRYISDRFEGPVRQSNRENHNLSLVSDPQSKMQQSTLSNRKTVADALLESREAKAKTTELKYTIQMLPDTMQDNEFIAYSLATKESNTGLFKIDCLLVLDSYNKELKYYKDYNIKMLPLTSIEGISMLKSKVIHLERVSKFAFVPSKTTLGLANITWFELGETKEWKIFLANTKLAIEWGQLINTVRKNEHLPENKSKAIYPDMKFDERGRKSVIVPSNVYRYVDTKKETDKKMHESVIVESTQKNGVENPVVMAMSMIETTKPNTSTRPAPKIVEEKKEESQTSNQKRNELLFANIVNRAGRQWEERLMKEEKYKKEIESTKHEYQRDSLLKESNHVAKKLEYEEIQEKVEAKPKKEIESAVTVKNDDAFPKDIHNEQEANRKSISSHNYVTNIKIISPKPAPRPVRRSLSNHSEVHEYRTNVIQNTTMWLCEWLKASDLKKRERLYREFLAECEKEVTVLWRTFSKSHFMSRKCDKHVYLFEKNGVDYVYQLEGQTSEEDSVERVVKKWKKIVEMHRKFDKVALVFSKVSFESRLRVPLSCVFSIGCLIIECKASLLSCNCTVNPLSLMTLEPEERKQLEALESACHISLLDDLSKSKILLHGPERYIYLDNMPCLPSLTINEQQVSILPTYINLFIKDGVISSREDLQAINQHMELLCVTAVTELENIYLLTCRDLKQCLHNRGLPMECLPRLYEICGNKEELTRFRRVLLSEMLAIVVEAQVRSSFEQGFIGRSTETENFKECLCNNMRTVLYQDTEQCKELIQRIHGIVISEEEIRKECFYGYFVSSVLIRLGVICDVDYIKGRPNEFWRGYPFLRENVLPEVVVLRQKHYIFPKEELIVEQDELKMDEQALNQLRTNFFEKILNEDCLSGNDSYYLLSTFSRSVVNASIVKFCNPLKHSNCSCLIKNLYSDLLVEKCRNIQDSHHYELQLIGIKWLIKERKYELAEAIIAEQQRYLEVWCNHCPEIMMKLNDLKAMFSVRIQREDIAKESCLQSVQLAMRSYEMTPNGNHNLQIVEKLFQAGTIFFDYGGYERALDHYATAENLMDKLSEEFQEEIGPVYIEIEYRRAMFYLLERNIKECIDKTLNCLGCCEQFRKILNAKRIENTNEEGIESAELFELTEKSLKVYGILLRCYEIKGKKIEMLNISCICSRKYIENCPKQVNPNSVVSWKELKYSNIDHKLDELTTVLKMIWLAIIKNINCIDKKPENKLLEQINELKLTIIYDELERMRTKYKTINRYTKKELYPFLMNHVELVEFMAEEELNSCRLLKVVLKCLKAISEQTRRYRPYRLYNDSAVNNEKMLLEAVCGIIGEDYVFGIVVEAIDASA